MDAVPRMICIQDNQVLSASPDCSSGSDCGYVVYVPDATNVFINADDIGQQLNTPYHANFKQLAIHPDYVLLYNTHYNTRVVVNRLGLKLLSSFQKPTTLANLLHDWQNNNQNTQLEHNELTNFIVQAIRLGLILPNASIVALANSQPVTTLTPTSQQLQPTQNKSTQPTEPVKPTEVVAWLHITDRCNLRCSYCYLPHHKVDMSLEMGKAVIDATFRSAVTRNVQSVRLKYAGGEAMLSFDLIKQLHLYAQKLAQQHDLELVGVVLSNGTLLDDNIVQNMLSLGMHLSISLDGIQDWQDSQRFYSNGRGTFADVTRSIKLALSYQIPTHISVTITGKSVAGLPQLMAWILEHNVSFSLSFYRENDCSQSSHTYEGLKLEEEAMITGMLETFKVIEADIPSRSLLNSLVDRGNLAASHTKTCGVGDNYMVFNHKGQVSKCQMDMQNPISSVQEHDPLIALQRDKSSIQNISVEEKEGCKSCEWKYWCTGGCPLVTYRATGRYDVQSPNCNIYKAIFPEVMRLEGLRILKFGKDITEQAIEDQNIEVSSI